MCCIFVNFLICYETVINVSILLVYERNEGLIKHDNVACVLPGDLPGAAAPAPENPLCVLCRVCLGDVYLATP